MMIRLSYVLACFVIATSLYILDNDSPEAEQPVASTTWYAPDAVVVHDDAFWSSWAQWQH